MRHILITAIALSFMMFSNAFAHHVWMEKRNGDIGILYGHGINKLDPYDPEKIKDVKGFDSKGKAVEVVIVKQKESALISPKGEAATISIFHAYPVGTYAPPLPLLGAGCSRSEQCE
ncbi:hypothetical protein [Desulfobacterium sp. N47]|uniref:DUF4198 domain-containing protein n=1 Tax=uncultured Desulfobacterium sp. TaxID=201089 RepID=E1YMR8_9BACT|nr:unknown protein [uncultured Desulfobacterium sp.]